MLRYVKICLVSWTVLGSVAAMASELVASDAGTVKILPPSIRLDGPDSSQQLLLCEESNRMIRYAFAPEDVQWTSSNENVLRIDDTRVVAVGDGEATVTGATADGRKALVTVTVTGTTRKREISFRHEVQSILARQGCSMGACHGALAGKGGFRLSLRGYDSVSDHYAITREARGRRIELGEPGASLILAKPSGALPHKGGVKLPVDTNDYQVLAQWIAAGAKGPTEKDPVLERIEVTPAQSLLAPLDSTRVLVTAHYDNGRAMDVTQWAKFSATDEAVLGVDEHGRVDVRGSGEGAVLVWFGSKVALSRMTVPFPYDVPANVYRDAPRSNFIDVLNLAQLETLRLKPSPPANPETFVRRATLDTIGRLPTASEREVFLRENAELSSAGEAKRRLIERLLSDEDFVDYWAFRLSDVLLINGTRLRPVAVQAYYEWLHDSIRTGKPWDQMVQQILTSTGVSTENGATNFYALHQSPEEMTENACQAFLGLSIGCAKCHNHPLEKWTNDQYYAMANLFSRVRAKGWGGEPRNGDGIRTVYVATEGELIQPRTGHPQAPAPLDGEQLAFDDPSDRRVLLADWMTSPKNPYFARSITNRVWANFFGRGLVEQVDDLRLSNPASNEPLFAALAEHLVASQFDLRRLMRTILESDTYGRSSERVPENVGDEKYYARYYPRRLMAEVLLDSIDQALQTTTSFKEIAFPGADVQPTEFYPKGTHAVELYDSAVRSYFLDAFGRNPREITCDCERSAEPTMVQVLHLSNGETLNPKLAETSNRIHRGLAEGRSLESLVDELFLVSVQRAPTEEELRRLVTIAGEYQNDKATAIADIAWSLLTSAEFIFNH